MINISNFNDRVEFSENGSILAVFPKNTITVLIGPGNPKHFKLVSSDDSDIIYDFFYDDVLSPSTATPEALMGVLTEYFYGVNIDFEAAAAQGKLQGISLVLKSGRNPAISSASVPEDIWNIGGAYTGFPTATAEEFQVLSSDAADTGSYTFSYLPSITSTEYISRTVTLNGTTPVNTGVTGIRSHTASYNNGNAATFNAGTITLRWRTTTTVIFHQMPIGTSQTYDAVYTIPFGSTGFVKRVFCAVHDSQSISVQGALWTRMSGQSPRLRRNFAAQSGSGYIEDILGGLSLPALTDLTMRVTQSSSASSTVVVGGFDIILATGA